MPKSILLLQTPIPHHNQRPKFILELPKGLKHEMRHHHLGPKQNFLSNTSKPSKMQVSSSFHISIPRAIPRAWLPLVTDSRTPHRGYRVPLLEVQVSTSRISFPKPMAPNSKSLTFLTSPQHSQHMYNLITSLFSKQYNGQKSKHSKSTPTSSFHAIPLHKTSFMQSKLLSYPFRTPK